MAENRRVFLSRVQLDLQAGVGLETGQGSDPVVMFRYSIDSGWTWSDVRLFAIGKIGRYDWRAVAFSFTAGRNYVFEFSGSDPVTTAILACYIEGSEGAH